MIYMLSNFEKIIEFHKCSNSVHNTEKQLDVVTKQPKLVGLRLNLIDEEYEELVVAVKNNDFIEIIDALADLLYVTYGSCSSFGINANNVYNVFNTQFQIQPEITKNNPNMVSLCLSNIQTEIDSLHKSISNNVFSDIHTSLFDILKETYRTCINFGIDPNIAFGLVHDSNMTKFCISEQEAKDTIISYKTDHRYDSPEYRQSGDKFVVFNKSTGKILKSINYKPVLFTSMFASKEKTDDVKETIEEMKNKICC